MAFISKDSDALLNSMISAVDCNYMSDLHDAVTKNIIAKSLTSEFYKSFSLDEINTAFSYIYEKDLRFSTVEEAVNYSKAAAKNI